MMEIGAWLSGRELLSATAVAVSKVADSANNALNEFFMVTKVIDKTVTILVLCSEPEHATNCRTMILIMVIR